MSDEPAFGRIATHDERLWATFCHLGAFAMFFCPFGNILAPLIIWLVKRESSSYIDMHGREALNFQISMSIYTFIAGIFIIVVIGFILVPILVLINLILAVLAAISANKGQSYQYPATIRFVK